MTSDVRSLSVSTETKQSASGLRRPRLTVGHRLPRWSTSSVTSSRDRQSHQPVSVNSLTNYLDCEVIVDTEQSSSSDRPWSTIIRSRVPVVPVSDKRCPALPERVSPSGRQ